MANFEKLKDAIRQGKYKSAAGARKAIAYAKRLKPEERKELAALVTAVWAVPPPPSKLPEREAPSLVDRAISQRNAMITAQGLLGSLLSRMNTKELREYAERADR